jgi:hypothetical protein
VRVTASESLSGLKIVDSFLAFAYIGHFLYDALPALLRASGARGKCLSERYVFLTEIVEKK